MVAAKLDTIAAIATAPGRGGIGVVRVSGAQAAAIAHRILGNCPAPRLARYGYFLDAEGEVIDRGIAIFFVSPHSYTGEDVLELQGHGGTAVMQRLLQRCLAIGAVCSSFLTTSWVELSSASRLASSASMRASLAWCSPH